MVFVLSAIWNVPPECRLHPLLFGGRSSSRVLPRSVPSHLNLTRLGARLPRATSVPCPTPYPLRPVTVRAALLSHLRSGRARHTRERDASRKVSKSAGEDVQRKHFATDFFSGALVDSVPGHKFGFGWRMNRGTGRGEHFSETEPSSPRERCINHWAFNVTLFRAFHFSVVSCIHSRRIDGLLGPDLFRYDGEPIFVMWVLLILRVKKAFLIEKSLLHYEEMDNCHEIADLRKFESADASHTKNSWSELATLTEAEQSVATLYKVKLITCLFVVYELHYALSEGDILSRKARKLLGFPAQQSSRGFRYNVKDEREQSSHFRKEERDRNGVVRGSYGLRDPNGSFRVVTYIADEKGFRVHVTSNEPGVGRQNPASVSVDRLPPAADTRTSNNPDLQEDRKIPGSQVWPTSYDFYAARNNQDSNNPEESSEKIDPLDLQKHLLNAGFYDGTSILKPKFPYGTSFPSEMNGYNSFQKSHKTDSSIQDGNERFDVKDPISWPLIPEDNSKFSSPGTTEIKEIGNFPHHLMSNTFPSFDNGDNVDRRPTRVPLGIINLLLNYPQQKVHKNLPDCDTVSSSVLCQPPPYYYKDYHYYNSTERISPFIQTSDDKEKFIEATLMDRLFKFVSTSDKNFSEKISKGVPRKDSSCSDNTNENRAGDLALTTSLNRPVIYNTISNTHINSLLKYGSDWNNPIPTNVMQNSQRMNSQYNPVTDGNIDSEQNGPLLNNKNILLLTSQNSETSEKSVLNLLKKLNVLGFIILPTGNKESQEQLLEHLGQKVSDTPKEKKPFKNDTDDSTQTTTKTDSKMNAEFSNATAVEIREISNTTDSLTTNISREEPVLSNENDQVESKPKLQLKNSEFLILDDTQYTNNQNDDHGTKTTTTTETTTHLSNWRKVFEEEYEKALVKNQTVTVAESKEEIQNPGIPHERVYQIHDPPIPLYDSRGMPINSENVPLHLHRYVPPAGITSFPWKFAIPRPAPPRSLAVPPRPSELS
ncbi:uncharacterized protein CDAR_164101 [Caerostris darwini]|uniref:Uncharacterized protein n=1 Tax=Caerostris darwini TaxID=1538125 RepID=A0AAV4U9R4_9ARAC|nr:uncharacterized protein CDAR_164101 [Caerostris darwini]